ncbi:zinc-finger of the MIZ type in Nse subunit-domain-containing protein [Truncatella angustata]|uniref:Zinc-finger of the MIZ type in Nse subunit-domain-containing protein n=1 Tax=Truncatella angustata TaxID=152316 RepID=A0A9P8UDQ0_9PEZI|nr:zinc-finger of the MIZ type in Nse subunit-domain-containing protein [Truncatella angustata]KAH6648027.1 zinc-finger of the MIZ type in Nse subunit-domain-containing protein [Truncatella angustata]
MRMENGEMPEDQEDEEEEEEGEEDEDDIQITGPLQRLRDNKRKLLSDYEGKSLYQRYGLNNDYINFKKLWHLALQPPGAEEKPLPDATRWFDGRNDDSDDEEDEDEDVVVAGEVRSLRCPLSQVMMTEPYTNRDGCKHTFEKAAIFEYLGNKPGRRGMCPQTGCGKEVALNDFSLDQYVLRQIKRAQRQNDGEDDEEDEEDMEDEEGQDESMLVTSQRNIKKERRRRDDMDDDED